MTNHARRDGQSQRAVPLRSRITSNHYRMNSRSYNGLAALVSGLQPLSLGHSRVGVLDSETGACNESVRDGF